METHSDHGVASGRPSPQLQQAGKMEGQSSIWEFFLWACPSSFLPHPQEAGECLSRLPRQFVLVISKHWALPHSLHSSNGQKPRPGLDQSPGLSALELGKPVGNRTRPTWGRGTKTRLPSELHGSQGRFFIKKFPDLSLGSEGYAAGTLSPLELLCPTHS